MQNNLPPSRHSLSSLELQAAQQIDVQCDQFEKELDAGRHPLLETYLQSLPPALQEIAFRELLGIEWERRLRQGQPVNIDDYRRRFPEYSAIVDVEHRRLSGGPPSESLRGTGQMSAIDTSCVVTRSTASTSDAIGEEMGAGDAIALPSRYQYLRTLGEGGFGRVYLARDRKLGRPVAIKVSRADYCKSAATRQALLNEAQTAAKLQHAGIVTVHDVSQYGEQLLIVQEYIPGGDLRETIEFGQVAPTRCIELLAAISEAVACSHDNGVIHRDLKPANILMGDDDRPRVADFGLAIYESRRVDLQGERAGSPAYMSPEMVRGETHEIDRRSDIWSLGIILYEMLTGQRPFQGNNLEQLFAAIEYNDPLPLRALRPELSERLEEICGKCLAKRPEDRYASAAELSADLHNWLVETRTISERLRWTDWRLWLTATALGGVVLTLGLLIYYVTDFGTVQIEMPDAPPHVEVRVDGIEIAVQDGATTVRLRAGEHVVTVAAEGKDELRNVILVRRGKNPLLELRLDSLPTYLERRQNLDDQARRNSVVNYAKQLATASHDIESRRLEEATKLLFECPSEQRGWEWNYLRWNSSPEVQTMPGHSATIYFATYSPNGNLVYTIGREDQQQVASVATGRLLYGVPREGGWPLGWAFSPDDQQFVQLLPNGTFVARNAMTGNETARIPGNGDESRELATFTPDGKFVVCVANGGEITLCNPENMSVARSLRGHTKRLTCLAFRGDGLQLATGSDDRTIRIWDWRTGMELDCHSNQPEVIVDLAFAATGQLVALYQNGNVASWQLSLPPKTPVDRQRLTGVRWRRHRDMGTVSPDGRWRVRQDDVRVEVADAATGKRVFYLDTHTQKVRGYDFRADGEMLCTVAGWFKASDRVRVWDFTHEWARRAYRFREGGVNCIAFAPDSTRIVSGGDDGHVTVGHIAFDDVASRRKGHEGPVRSVAWSAKGDWIASGGDDRIMRIWKSDADQPPRVIEGHAGAVTCLAFSPDGEFLASGSVDQSIRLWETQTGRLLRTIAGHEGAISSIAISPDGGLLASASNDKTVRIMSLKSDASVVSIPAHDAAVRSLAFHPQGHRVASASDDGHVRVWDIDKKSRRYDLAAFQGAAVAVAFGPDGRRLAAVGADQTIRIFDSATGVELLSLPKYPAQVRGLHFSPDGHWLASFADDGTLKLWDGK